MAKKKAASKKNPYEKWKNAARAERRGGGADFWKPGKGRCVVRVVPFMHDGDLFVFADDSRHWNVQGPKTNVLCPGKGCPICAIKKDLPEKIWQGKTGMDGYKKARRFVVNLVVRKDPEYDNKDHFVRGQVPQTVKEAIEDLILGEEVDGVVEKPEVPNALDLKKGRDFRITRKDPKGGKGFVKYEVRPMPKDSVVGIKTDPVDLLAVREKSLMDMDDLQAIADEILEAHAG